jgi:hypothetical protein
MWIPLRLLLLQIEAAANQQHLCGSWAAVAADAAAGPPVPALHRCFDTGGTYITSLFWFLLGLKLAIYLLNWWVDQPLAWLFVQKKLPSHNQNPIKKNCKNPKSKITPHTTIGLPTKKNTKP